MMTSVYFLSSVVSAECHSKITRRHRGL